MEQDIKSLLELVAEKAARKSADEAVKNTLTSLGFEPEKPTEMQADMMFVRNLRYGSESMRRLVQGAVVSTLVGSGLWLLWSAFKVSIARL